MSAAWRALCALLALYPVLAHANDIGISVTDPAGQPLPDVAVHAKPLSAPPPRLKPGSAIIDQVNKEFTPLVSVVQVGTLISFPNKDSIRHNIYSFSPAKPLRLPLYSGTPAEPVLFDKPGQVVLGCNIHDWMIGYVLVVDSPWFGKTDSKGQLNLAELPNGEYELEIWHPYQSPASPAQKIKLAPGAPAQFSFRLKLAPAPERQRGHY
ncbi:methylamine utilization protein [Chitinimonas arctica]|uniref:methylamine utilization protein n=1 Tax=Chitinimonas arctica TaxID=2594795 RepID=UPI0015D39B14|nr:methylamine utilization protein [Chitinimonas arctica]